MLEFNKFSLAFRNIFENQIITATNIIISTYDQYGIFLRQSETIATILITKITMPNTSDFG